MVGAPAALSRASLRASRKKNQGGYQILTITTDNLIGL